MSGSTWLPVLDFATHVTDAKATIGNGNGSSLAYNVAAFVCALFVLEFGADKFIDHTVALAKRLNVPQGLLALLTAGAEWEELAVVVVSLARGRSSLALGNIVGSSISNIVGAFSLGLLFVKPDSAAHRRSGSLFDRSSKIYTLVQLVLTAMVSVVLLTNQSKKMGKIIGGLLGAIFMIYVASVAWYIRKGILDAPELSDSDSDSDSDTESETDTTSSENNERSSLLASRPRKATRQRSSLYHAIILLIGMGAIILSSFVLSHAATGIASALGLSDILVGVVILALATTLPEKLIAVMSGSRGHLDIMLANTVGSNIFLLALCLAVTMIYTGGEYDNGKVGKVEVAVMLASSIVLTLVVWAPPRLVRAAGVVMFVGYVAFCVAEFVH